MPKRKLTIPKFVAKKATGEKITMLTAYDYTMASWLDRTDVDAILVGDSLGMVIQGHSTTLPVTLDEMIYHAQLVSRGANQTMVVVDLPFPENHCGVDNTVRAAASVVKATQCAAIKLEGGIEQADTIRVLVSAGIPVMAHTGLRPQNVNVMGGYKVQRDEDRLTADAIAFQEAGAFSVVLECVPTDIAARISQQLDVPTIGIGAGVGCDGQVLVTHDLIGLTPGRVPKFVKPLADVSDTINTAVSTWTQSVRDQTFPDDETSYR